MYKRITMYLNSIYGQHNIFGEIAKKVYEDLISTPLTDSCLICHGFGHESINCTTVT